MKQFRLIRKYKNEIKKGKWINQNKYTIKTQLEIMEISNILSDNGEWYLEYREV